MIDKLGKLTEEFASNIVKIVQSLTLDELAGMMVARASRTETTTGPKRGRPKGSKNKPKTTEKPEPKAATKPKTTTTKTSSYTESRRIQGQYLGFLRNFSAKEKAKIKTVAKKNGVPAAVAMMLKKLGRT